MSTQDQKDETQPLPEGQPAAPPVSPALVPVAQPAAQPAKRTTRRNILAGVAGVGIAAAAGAGAAYAVTNARTATQAPKTKPVAVASMAPTAMAGPLVVYVNDTTTGEVDVFGGTGQMRLNDPWLVSQLLKAMK